MPDNKVKITIETDAGRSEQVLNSVKNSLQGVEKQSKSTAKGLQNLSVTSDKSISGIVSSLKQLGSAFAIAKTAKEAFLTAKDASRYNEIALYARNAANSVGVNFERMVEASKRGANGMADNVSIMQANLKALKLGLNASADEIGELWKIANATGDELGLSIEQTFERITEAIVSGNSRSLISLGVLSDNFERAGNSADLLTKRGDLLKTVLDQLGKNADKLNEYGDTGYDKYQQLDTAFKNLKTTLGQQIAPAFETCVGWLTKIVETGDKAIKVLGMVTFMSNNPENPYFAYSQQDLQNLKKEKSQNAYDYRFNADVVSGKIPIQSITQEQKGVIFGSNTNWALKAKTEEQELKQIEEALQKITQLEQKRQENLTEFEIALENISSIKFDNIINGLKDVNSIQKASTQLMALGVNSMVGSALNIADFSKSTRPEEAKETAKKREKDATNLINEINSGLNKALNITNKSVSDNIELMYKAGLQAMGFGSDVDEAAAEAYEAMKKLDDEVEQAVKAFDDLYARQQNLTEFEIALENISSIKFDNIINGLKDVNSIQKASTQLMALGVNLMVGSALNIADFSKSTRPEEAKETTKKGWSAIKNEVIGGFSRAVTKGIINSNLSDALRSLVSAIATSKATSYGTTIFSSLFSGKGLSGIGGAVSGLVGSIAVGAVASNWKKWFGDKNKAETMASNASTIERGSQAWLNTYSAMLNPYITDEMLYELQKSRYAASQEGALNVSWKSKKRGGLAGLAGGKNYTDTTPQSTFDLIKAMEKAVDTISEYNDKKKKELELLEAEGFSYKVLNEQFSALSETIDRTKFMNQKYTHSWSSGEEYSIDLSKNLHDLNVEFVKLKKSLGEANAEINKSVSSSFLSMYPVLSPIKNFKYGWNELNISQYYDVYKKAFTDLNVNQINTSAMLNIIKQSGLNKFNLSQLSITDSEKYEGEYLKMLQKQQEAAAYVMQQQEKIYRDMTKTYEEQSAALEQYEAAMNAYYDAQLQALEIEQQKQENLKKQEQRALLQRQERIESLLGFTGEIAKTGNKIYFIEAPKTEEAIKEIMKEWADDPQAIAALQSLLVAAQNKNKFGKI